MTDHQEAAERVAGIVVDSYENDFRRAVRAGAAWPDPRSLVAALSEHLEPAYAPEQRRERIACLTASVAYELAVENVVTPPAVASIRRRFDRAIAEQFESEYPTKPLTAAMH
ncbi:hypothetical protein J2D73_16725 [Acetobacter sacchari]|uniref:Uncharacterized protein n=1 Tax=Acetobacter sacchari TaxID=2661687 RepID=A0ABS3LZU4_9PROT|nr:hypothetical protein [Acetobacter sacchari]MBO1361431.1 hypothetical protein [Acetobacter sacchari]